MAQSLPRYVILIPDKFSELVQNLAVKSFSGGFTFVPHYGNGMWEDEEGRTHKDSLCAVEIATRNQKGVCDLVNTLLAETGEKAIYCHAGPFAAIFNQGDDANEFDANEYYSQNPW